METLTNRGSIPLYNENSDPPPFAINALAARSMFGRSFGVHTAICYVRMVSTGWVTSALRPPATMPLSAIL